MKKKRIYIHIARDDRTSMKNHSFFWVFTSSSSWCNCKIYDEGLTKIGFKIGCCLIGCNEQGELTNKFQMNWLSLRYNWLKFKILGKLPIILEEYTSN